MSEAFGNTLRALKKQPYLSPLSRHVKTASALIQEPEAAEPPPSRKRARNTSSSDRPPLPEAVVPSRKTSGSSRFKGVTKHRNTGKLERTF